MEVLSKTGEESQSLWPKLLDIIGRDTFTLWVTVPFIITHGTYWILGGLYLLMDITEKPSFLRKYKIQPGTNEPMDREKLLKLIKAVLFNQFCINIPMGILNWRLIGDRRSAEEVEIFPSVGEILRDWAVCLLLQEIGFYYTHRLLHHRVPYKFIHKTHHEWTSPIAISAMLCHPIEHVIGNLIPPFLGPFVTGCHPVTAWIWFNTVILATLNDHSDYHFPLLLSSRAHDFHHQKFNTCFGIIGLMDWLHGTDAMFRASPASNRHKVFLTMKPQKEKLPDISKKSL